MSHMPIRSLSTVDFGEGVARLLIERLRIEIDRRIENPALRESRWSFFLAMAGTWATEEGLQQPGAYQALKPVVEKVMERLPQKRTNATLTGIAAVKLR